MASRVQLDVVRTGWKREDFDLVNVSAADLESVESIVAGIIGYRSVRLVPMLGGQQIELELVTESTSYPQELLCLQLHFSVSFANEPVNWNAAIALANRSTYGITVRTDRAVHLASDTIRARPTDLVRLSWRPNAIAVLPHIPD